MIDKDRSYKLKELLELYGMYNLDFKFYGNNDKGTLELYLKTDSDKVSVFKSINVKSKYDYLSLSEEEAMDVDFIFEREVDELELDIIAVVVKTSDVNIPCGKYTLKSLDKYLKEQDKEDRKVDNNLPDGISYMIVDQNTTCDLYDGVYIFDKNNKGLIESLRENYKKEKESLLKSNLKMILDYYDDLIEKSSIEL